MKLRYLSPLPVAVFLISLLFSTIIIQTQTGILTETRKSALVRNLSQARFEKGSHLSFFVLDEETEDAFSTAEVLYPLKVLDELDTVDVQKGLDYIVSRQSLTVDNSTLWGWPGPFYNWTYLTDLYVPFIIMRSLKVFSSQTQLNKTALIQVVLARYNETDGAFHEPLIKVNTDGEEKEYALCAFPLDFHSTSDVAYANSNMISTFLGVSVLANLQALDAINSTKTINWILSSKGENGAFKPFPESEPEHLPGWSSLQTNPFYVDRFGTGIAYTYAAIGALKALGVNVQSVVEVDKVRNYVLSSQQLYPGDTIRFLAHPDDNHSPDFALTYYAVMTMYYLGIIEEEGNVTSKVVAYLLQWLQDPSLHFNDSWPVPTRDDTWYGLFVDFPPLSTTYFSIAILNATNRLNVLDQPTPMATKTWYNTVLVALGFSMLSIIGSVIFMTVHNRRTQQPRPTNCSAI